MPASPKSSSPSCLSLTPPPHLWNAGSLCTFPCTLTDDRDQSVRVHQPDAQAREEAVAAQRVRRRPRTALRGVSLSLSRQRLHAVSRGPYIVPVVYMCPENSYRHFSKYRMAWYLSVCPPKPPATGATQPALGRDLYCSYERPQDRAMVPVAVAVVETETWRITLPTA